MMFYYLFEGVFGDVSRELFVGWMFGAVEVGAEALQQGGEELLGVLLGVA